MPNLLHIVITLLAGAFPSTDRMRAGPLVRALGAGETRHGRADLDGDHVADCWSLASDSGSGFGSLHVEVRPRCGEKAYGLDEMSSFGELLADLGATEPGFPRALVNGLARAIYGSAPRCERAHAGCEAIDPAFAWLLDERRSRDAGGAWRTFAPHLNTGRPKLPNDEVLVRETGGDFTGFVSMAGGWVGSVLVPGARCGETQLWTTEHGVIAEDLAAHHWQWVFLSTALDKLRWPSIVSASCSDDTRTITVVRRGQDFALERITILASEGRWRSEPIER